MGRLMPLHLCLDGRGQVVGQGPLIGRVAGNLIGLCLFDHFAIRRPAHARTVDELMSGAGGQVDIAFGGAGPVALRGLAVRIGSGALLHLSFGIGVIDAVRRYGLTVADFSPTDLTVELLYLVEANAAVQAELRSLNQRLQGARDVAEAVAMTDPLTGLANRRAFDAALDRACAGAAGFALLHLDLDHFKAVNDRLGHAAGDHVLRTVAEILRSETRDTDIVARLGGDEFTVLMSTSVADAALRIASRIIERVSVPILFEGEACKVAASLGLALSPPRSFPDPEDLFRRADDALYAAKRSGRGRAVLADPPRRS